MGTYIIGPRTSRVLENKSTNDDDDKHLQALKGVNTYNKKKSALIKLKPIKPHSMPFVAMGGIMLFFGFLFFNGASGLFADADLAAASSLATANTVIAASGGMLSMMSLRKWESRFLSLGSLVNGMLAGCVAVCAGCTNYYPYAALVVGIAGGVTCVVGKKKTRNERLEL